MQAVHLNGRSSLFVERDLRVQLAPAARVAAGAIWLTTGVLKVGDAGNLQPVVIGIALVEVSIGFGLIFLCKAKRLLLISLALACVFMLTATFGIDRHFVTGCSCLGSSVRMSTAARQLLASGLILCSSLGLPIQERYAT